jgi:amino acid permease
MLMHWFSIPAFRHAAAALVGTMVGVGIFGVPFIFARAGFWVGMAWLVAIAAFKVLFYTMFTELMLRTEGVHQLAGYAGIWLNSWGKRVVTFMNILGIYGALLAYTIVVGGFLHNILSSFTAIEPTLYSVLFTAVLAPILLARLRTVAFVEQALTVLFVVVVALIVFAGFGDISPGNYAQVMPDRWFLPYGVLLFAFGGLTSMPIMRQLLVGRERAIRPAVITAIILVAIVYFLFAAVVVGISGSATSPDAISGLFGILGMPILILGSLLGILTISTSYIMLGTAMYEIFHIDYHLRRPVSWLLVVVPPLVFFSSGLRNFIDVIGLVGAVAGGITIILFIVAYLKARTYTIREPEFTLRVPVFVWYLLMAMFAVGVVLGLR